MLFDSSYLRGKGEASKHAELFPKSAQGTRAGFGSPEVTAGFGRYLERFRSGAFRNQMLW